MSSTLDSIVWDITNISRGALISTTEPISYEQVARWVSNTRVTLIKQDLDKRRSINPDIISTLCVDFQIADKSTCPCNPVDCTILQSTKDIPEAIETQYKNLLISAGPLDISKARFNLVDSHRARFYGNNKFTSSIPVVFLYNKRLYFLAKEGLWDMLRHLSLEIVLERPEEADGFSCSGTPCFSSSTTKYPIAAWMLEPLKQMIIQNNLKVETTAPHDSTANLGPDLNPAVEPKGN